jgi:hypothetical protein
MAWLGSLKLDGDGVLMRMAVAGLFGISGVGMSRLHTERFAPLEWAWADQLSTLVRRFRIAQV